MKSMWKVLGCVVVVGWVLMGWQTMAAAAPFAYVMQPTASSVAVIDIANNTVITTIPISGLPQVGGIAAAPDGSRVYVASQGNLPSPGNNVLAIATATNTVVATIPVEIGPYGLVVTPDGSRVYVACIDGDGAGSVDVIDVASGTVTASIPTESGDGVTAPIHGNGPLVIAITPDGSRAYVTFLVTDDVAVIDTTTNQLVQYIGSGIAIGGGVPDPVGLSFGIATNPTRPEAYVTLVGSFPGDGSVVVLDTTTNSIAARIPSEGRLSGPTGIAFTPDGTRAYVANESGNFVSVIDTTSRTITPNILVGTNPIGVAITPDGSRAYVTVYGTNSVAVIDTTSQAVVATISLTAPPFYIAIANPAASAPVVTVAATDPTAAEVCSNGSPDPGTFTVTRSGGTTNALTVNFALTGSTATQGTDYNNVGTSVTIPAGQASATVTITPIPDTQADGSETVILTLASGTGYTVGSPNTATVNIANYAGGLLRGPTSVNFNNVRVGSSADRSLNIANGSATAPLVVTVNNPIPTALFSLVSAGGTFVIGPGLSQQVLIRFTPTSAGSGTGTLVLSSTDPANTTKSITLDWTAR